MHRTKIKNIYLLPIKQTKEIGKFKYFYVGHKMSFCKFWKTKNYLNFMVLKLKTRKQKSGNKYKKKFDQKRELHRVFSTQYI